MSHRPGHIDDTNLGGQSMDRRKYLKALAVGTVGAGALLESACTTLNVNAGSQTGVISWGYLSLYDPAIISIEDAKTKPLKESRFRIPFFNSNGISIAAGDVIGFQLIKIGSPPIFALAINLAEEHGDSSIERNEDMNKFLRSIGYKEETTDELLQRIGYSAEEIESIKRLKRR